MQSHNTNYVVFTIIKRGQNSSGFFKTAYNDRLPDGISGYTQITNKTLGEIPEGLFYKGLVKSKLSFS